MVTCDIIIPVYNEEKAIESTLVRLQKIVARVPEIKMTITCVNDGSGDGTEAIIKKFSDVRCINHEVNRGYGAALRTGLNQAQSEWIFIVDADGTYPIEQLPEMTKLMSDEISMIVGARRGTGIVTSPFKRIARWILRKMVHVLTGVMVPDLNSGMRLFRRSLYQEFRHLLPMGFSFTSTITVASLYSGYRIKYMPIDYDRRVGKSNIKPLKDFYGFTILIVRLATYFEPLSFFQPLSLFFFILSLARGIRDVLVANAIGNLAIILFIIAVQSFITGILADVVVRSRVDQRR